MTANTPARRNGEHQQPERLIVHQQPVTQAGSQAANVEQSRAVAQVQAAIVAAHQFPRNVPQCLAAMEEACAQPELARRAIFSYRRGGSEVSGPSIYLARELARVWGNIDSGLIELERDLLNGQSEVLAYAQDLETNRRQTRTIIVRHERDQKNGGVTKLSAVRDVSEMIANQGARAERECIFSVLPEWLIERAKALCVATNKHGGGIPIAERIAKAIAAYAGARVRLEQLEARLGRPQADWDGQDVAQLEGLWQALVNRETTREAEFPADRITADQLGQPAPHKPAGRAPVMHHVEHVDQATGEVKGEYADPNTDPGADPWAAEEDPNVVA